MTRYDYRCPACRVDFEVARSFADADAPLECPMCGGPAQRPFRLPTLAEFAAIKSSGSGGDLQAGGDQGAGSSHGHRHAAGTPDHRH